MTGHSAQKSVRRTSGWQWTPAAHSPGTPHPWWLPSLRHTESAFTACDGLGGQKDQESATWPLAPDYASVKVARDRAAIALREWGLGRLANDVELVVSELVTNALRHGAQRLPLVGAYNNHVDDGTIQLSMMRQDGELVCAVRDTSDQLPAPREPDFLAETGRGLHLVSCFSRSWGAIPTAPCGKFVWALFT